MVSWLLCIWLLTFTIDVGPLFLWEEKIFGYNMKYGICNQRSAHPYISLYNGIVFLIAFPIPFATIVISFIVIFAYLKRHSDNLVKNNTPTPRVDASHITTLKTASIQNNATKQRLYRRQVLITKNMLIVVCAFFACIAPYAVGMVIPGSDPTLPYFAILLYSNSAVNPIIYAKHPTFQEIFSFIIRGKFKDIPEKTALLEGFLKSK